MTKKELYELIEDAPMDAELLLDTPSTNSFEKIECISYYEKLNRIILHSHY